MNSKHQEYSPISTAATTQSTGSNNSAPGSIVPPSEWSNQKVFIQQGIPIAGVPQKNSYLQLNELDTPSPNDKLESWGFVCYKYWILVSMAVVSILIVGKVLSLFFFGRAPWTIVSLFLCSWHFVQSICVFEGMNKRDVSYIENAIYLMKLYSPGFWICTAMHSIEVIEAIYARHFYNRHIGELLGLSFLIACFAWGLFYFCYIYGAMKVKDILEATQVPEVIPHHQQSIELPELQVRTHNNFKLTKEVALSPEIAVVEKV